MKYGVCNNPNCDLCLNRDIQEIEVGEEFVCKECGKPLTETEKGGGSSGDKKGKRVPIIIAAAVVVVVGIVLTVVMGGKGSTPPPPPSDIDTVKVVTVPDTVITLEPVTDTTKSNGRASGSDVQPKPKISTMRIPTNGTLEELIVALLNPNATSEYRLSVAAHMLESRFASNAKVATVGRNGETVVDMEDARQFLNRVALSSAIRRLEIVKVSRDSNGKIVNMTVKEIRN